MRRVGKLVQVLSIALLCLAWAAAALGQTKAIPQRSDIDDRYKWRLEDIYETTAAWEADFERVKAQLPALAAMQGQLAASAANLHAALVLRDSLNDIVDRLWVYSNLKFDEDSRVSEYQVLSDRASIINTELASTAAFIEPEIVAMPEAELRGFIDGFEPLGIYRHHLEDMLRKKAHTLSEPEEKLLADAAQVTRGPRRIYDLLEAADLKFGVVVDEQGDSVALTRERYWKFMESTDRRLRREADAAFHKPYVDLQNTFAAAYSASVQADIFLSRSRKYNSTLEMRLDANDIPAAAYESLIATVNANLEPYHRYGLLAKKVLGVDTLHRYDTYVSLAPEAAIEFTWEEAQKTVLDGLEPLGKTYRAELRKALESRWIDVYETEGKASGAYNTGAYSTHPYMLMNFSGTLEQMFTLGHELGHAMHGYYSHAHQPYVYGYNPTFTAEVASTTNEVLIMHYLLKRTKDPAQKKYLLDYFIRQIRGTYYTQTFFSEFEHKIHRMMEAGEPVSTQALRSICREIYERYLGPEVLIDESNDMIWARISQFYRSYYVYQYATSYSAGTYIARQILAGNKELRDKYLEFLKSGSSSYPVEQLKAMGVDLTTPGPAKAVADQFRDLVTELEKLLLES